MNHQQQSILSDITHRVNRITSYIWRRIWYYNLWNECLTSNSCLTYTITKFRENGCSTFLSNWLRFLNIVFVYKI